MAKDKVAQVAPKLYELLVPLTPEERARVVRSTLILFGDDDTAAASHAPGSPVQGGAPADAATYFDEKKPANKGEELAVAARFLETVNDQESYSRQDLKKVIVAAHLNFDDKHFTRDMDNAKRRAAFFNLGTKRDTNKLSYFGKKYVDALPDRDAANNLTRPKVGGPRKGRPKKESTRAK